MKKPPTIPQCSFCERPAAAYRATHVTYVYSKVESKYVPCCLYCLKRRRDKQVKLVPRPGP